MTRRDALRPLPFPDRALIGMVHVLALPGAPHHGAPLREIVSRAVEEARTLVDAGFDAIIVENMHDRPYVNEHGPQTTAAMAAVCMAVREAVGEKFPLGVQVLSRGEKEALAVALVCGAAFIRCENFVFSHVADEGLMVDAAAGPLLRYRRAIGADHVMIFADIKKKHASHALTADIDLAGAVHGAQFFGADAVIITGAATGLPAASADVRAARGATDLPVLVGSGVSPEQVGHLFESADALIVGSWIKHGGQWHNPVDKERAKAMVSAARAAKGGR